ncbi:hypothetical protein [Salinarimonas sp.]|uniref:hypothetical protein n=1 Tax=Salinarimonas sp. TaxID=2766526 RepID=UPI0032D90AC9
MPASLHDVLAEIAFPAPSAPRLPAPSPEPVSEPEDAATAEPRVTPAFGPRAPKPEEIEARVAAAYERGLTEAREATEAALAAALEQARAEAAAAREEALAAARAAWAEETADRLAGLLIEGLGAVEERLSEAAARALAPLLHAAARDRALEGLAAAVSTLLRADPALVLTLRGPADLGEALIARLGSIGAALRFTPADAPDLVVEGEGTLIETRLAAWAERVRADAA